MEIACSKCRKVFIKFRKHGRICRPCISARQREARAKNGNCHTRSYEKTPKGFIMRTYRNMQSRVEGVQKAKAHLYVGKQLLPRDEFYAWSLSSPRFWNLFESWAASNYLQKLTPSIDRVDSSEGYTLDNIRWLTHSENSSLGARKKIR